MICDCADVRYMNMTDVRYMICDCADVGCMNMTDVRDVICNCCCQLYEYDICEVCDL